MQWRVTRRETGLVEHVCEHGVGHPNYYSAVRLYRESDDYQEDLKNAHPDGDQSAFHFHGCDHCCQREDFPGARTTNEALAALMEGIIREFWLGQVSFAEVIAHASFLVHDGAINIKRELGLV